MNIIIRTDASVHIGTGHVVRCLTLAEKLRQRGANISFICREETGNLTELIKNKSYKVYPLPAGINLKKDIELTKNFIKDQRYPPDWLIVDHYEINSSWESSLREFVKKIMVIDDLVDRKHDCELLLDQNYNENPNRYKRLVPDKCMRLLGPTYALLRPQFFIAREKLRERNSDVKRILVFMGGSDPTGQTSRVLSAIKKLNRLDIVTDVVIGSSNSKCTEIENLISSMPNTTYHFNVENMAELMSYADLAIGAGGTASWERCCVGLPSVVITIADNQTGISQSLSKKGCCIDLGWYEHVSIEKIKNCLDDLIMNSMQLVKISRACLSLVDGLGSGRVSDYLFNN